MTNRLPRNLLDVLPADTALAAHLHHRVSRDLDFFSPVELDVPDLRTMLESLGTFAATTDEADTLNGVFNDAKVQFLRTRNQDALEPPTDVAGIPVASLRDIAATKLKTIADRGELRDYFDLMTIEQHTAITMEPALQDYQERYQTRDRNTLLHIIRALGTFNDVTDDPGLPVPRASIDTTGAVNTHPPAVTGSSTIPALAAASLSNPSRGNVWVHAHERNGRIVNGYWRRR